MEIDQDAQALKRKRISIPKKKICEPLVNQPNMVAQNLPPPVLLPEPAPHANIEATAKISVSEFDYSVENHFKAVDSIVKLCGQSGTVDSDQSEIERFSNSITFLREWRDFNYSSRVVRFAFQHNSEKKDIVGEVTLPQFSAASVPKLQNPQIQSKITDTKSSKDFVMHVGGAVWALDWCPRVDNNSENDIEPEFVAIAAHPPESSYHKIGSPLTGRGVIQIWCVLAFCEEKDVPSQCNKKPRPTQKKVTVMANEATKMHRPRGRPRKKPIIDPLEEADTENQYVEPLAVEYPEGSSSFHPSDKTSVSTSKSFEGPGRTQKECNQTKHANALTLISVGGRGNQAKAQNQTQVHNNDLRILRQDEHQEPSLLNPSSSASYHMNSSLRPHNKINCLGSCDTSRYFVPKDIALPRMMLCLAHNGKVAWDVKWRPYNGCDPQSMKRMGYLAVLLGNGALEVWEVPLPQTVKLVYPDCQECVDPRFIKLQPVFRCSILKCGDRQSIPLTLEWSVSDRILVGCHDGAVALWQFSVTDPSTETRPLLSFSADTGPIRALAWAPNQSDVESANVIVTGGHRSFKFWDIRDPFRPSWEHPIQGLAYSLSWLQEPRCVFGSIDDGTLWMVNLVKTASDFPIAGKSHAATKWGTHNFDCSSFSIWSVHASQLTGMVAYCGEDGTAFCFQPTSRSVNDPSRNRIHHHLCGSLLEEGSDLIVVSLLTNSPFIKRCPSMKRGSTAARYQETKTNEPVPKETCGGSDAAHELGCDDSSLTIKKQSSKNTPEDDQEVKSKEKSVNEIQVLPPKIVSMHRVRWNANKKCKKWLCYGGAAGLVRCQEVDISGFE
ncbi:uncharacterized protein LOC142549461 isoform X2 [Primulina tabacum]|uniref:uncharacterized protein LOC142549461 isoform X2 n=1 Tax=Primulina tabacum TaxID=48773 RepID=UPI003F59A34B